MFCFDFCVILNLTNNLTSLNGGGQIEGIHIGEDGKPYITYKVGADTVTKKLGSSNLQRIRIGSGNTNGVQSFSVASYDGFKDFTIANFAIQVDGFWIPTGQSLEIALAHPSYNADTGILTVPAYARACVISNKSAYVSYTYTVYLVIPA